MSLEIGNFLFNRGPLLQSVSREHPNKFVVIPIAIPNEEITENKRKTQI